MFVWWLQRYAACRQLCAACRRQVCARCGARADRTANSCVLHADGKCVRAEEQGQIELQTQRQLWSRNLWYSMPVDDVAFPAGSSEWCGSGFPWQPGLSSHVFHIPLRFPHTLGASNCLGGLLPDCFLLCCWRGSYVPSTEVVTRVQCFLLPEWCDLSVNSPRL